MPSSTIETIERAAPTTEPRINPQPPTPNPPARRALWLHLGVLALFTGLAVIATWPLLPRLWWSTLDYPTYSDTLISSYLMSWQAHALITDPAHLLDTNTLYPFTGTVAYDELNFAPALLAAPVFWLTGNTMLAHNALTLATFVLAGYSAWLLGRALTGSGWAGLVVGVGYAFSTYRFNHIAHITLVNGQWLPLVLLCLHRLWGLGTAPGSPPRRMLPWAAGFALFFTLQAYSSHYFAFFTAGAVALFAGYYALTARRLPARFFGALAGGGGVSLALLAPLALAYYRVQGAADFARPLWDAERYSNTLQSFLAVWEANPLYRALLAPFADPGPWPWERSAFPGLVPLALGALGVAGLVGARSRGPGVGDQDPNTQHAIGNTQYTTLSPQSSVLSPRRDVGFYLLLTLVAAIISLGPTLRVTFDGPALLPLPYRLLYDWVPGVASMRAVTRIGFLSTLGLSMLMGYGILDFRLRILDLRSRLIQNPKSKIQNLTWPTLALGVSALLLAETWTAPRPMLPIQTGVYTPPVYQWLAGQPRQVTVEYPMVHRERGPRNVAMNDQYLYYAATHWQPLVNGDYTLKPSAYSAMQLETERCFPCPRSLDALWALGTQRVVVHLDNLTGPQQEEFLWRADPANIPHTGLNPGEFRLVQDFHEVKVYELGPRPLAELRDHLPPGGAIVFGDKAGDLYRLGAYNAALGWWLRDHLQYGDPTFSYGQVVTDWKRGMRAEAAILYTGQDPAPYGFTAAEAAWHNEHVVLYVHQ